MSKRNLSVGIIAIPIMLLIYFLPELVIDNIFPEVSKDPLFKDAKWVLGMFAIGFAVGLFVLSIALSNLLYDALFKKKRTTKKIINMSYLKYNLNYNIKVRLTDLGIEHYVNRYNRHLPFKSQMSFREFKSKEDTDGYHRFQMHDFIDVFGGLGLGLDKYVNTNIYLFEGYAKQVEEIE